jgi:hypothetical protein
MVSMSLTFLGDLVGPDVLESRRAGTMLVPVFRYYVSVIIILPNDFYRKSLTRKMTIYSAKIRCRYLA